MPKQTLYFTSKTELSILDNQLNIVTNDHSVLRPIEDIQTIIVDHHSVSFTVPLINKLAYNNIAVVFCNEKHLPTTMLMDLNSNALQSKSFRAQLEASQPLKKQLWKQIVIAKISNQSQLLTKKGLGKNILKKYLDNVKAGDTTNREGIAAKVYWKYLFGKDFIRDRYAPPPNNMLNYGYSVLRAAIARALMNSGLLPSVGVFHKNYYNAFPLADDTMEPYRPFIDEKVADLYSCGFCDIDKQFKKEIITLFYNSLTTDILSSTTKSLADVYCGSSKIIRYPNLII